VRVAVYNVRGFRAGVEEVAGALERFRPDLILLQESGSRWALRRFARRLGMDVATDPRAFLRRRVKDAVLVRPPWRIVEHRQHRFATIDRFYPRGALIARLDASGRRCWAVCVHLGLRRKERGRHAREALRLLAGVEGPILLGGDLNELPDGPAVQVFGRRLRDVWLLGGDVAGKTFPAEDPTARIDYLFVSEDVRVERALVPSGPEIRTASDHRPLIAEIELPS
jgi:endonuclease/exonuclease/phosphatase family metal-dependent hydrolase